MPPAAANEEMSGSVERVTFHSEETGFCVLRVKVKGQRKPQTIIGSLPHVVPGEWIEAQGEWIVDRQHGRQFKAEKLRTMPPDSEEGIIRFLGSGLVKGIGPVYARKLVEHFGREVFDVIEKRSAQLEKVEGIGKGRRKNIKDGWNAARDTRAIMAFLMSHGVSTARAFRIYKTYGESAITTVQADPYCLARDIHGIGFQTADAIAQSLGIAPDSELRARAGVEHVLSEVTNEGHCAYPREDLEHKTADLLGVDETLVTEAVEHGLENERLVQELKLSPGESPLIYLKHLYECERLLARDLQRLSQGTHPCPPVDADKALAWVEKRTRLKLAPNQQEAIRQALTAKVMVITGGPGVGKTTLVNSLIQIFSAKKLKVRLCAPTGRAAKRLGETSRRMAFTIHRLLHFDPSQGGFQHDRKNPLSGDIFVVDEASMIDLPLAYQLIRAIPPHAALVLVGDVDQLPSVGPGTVLRSIIDARQVATVILDVVFRQAARSAIVTNAHRINRGEYPYPGSAENPSDFYLVECEEAEQAADRVVDLLAKKIPARFAIPAADIQVLVPMQRGCLGAQNLNARLQDALNPSEQQIERFGCCFRQGDKVMQLQNDYDKEVYNGDMGRVLRIDIDKQELSVDFGKEPVSYDFHELDELQPSYAITIHKSQGSEYPCVVVPVHTQHYIMLQRNLIYTAVTRGKKLVILVGTAKALAMAVNRHDARKRIALLKERMVAGG